jgi:hypothetical protein
VSDEQQKAILWGTLGKYQAARKRLAALQAQAEDLGNYLSIASYALKTNHNLWAGEHSGGMVDLEQWPTADQIKQLIEEIVATQTEKNRRAAILKDAGFDHLA